MKGVLSLEFALFFFLRIKLTKVLSKIASCESIGGIRLISDSRLVSEIAGVLSSQCNTVP